MLANNNVNDLLDDPFLSNFMDISLLQDTSDPLLSSGDQEELVVHSDVDNYDSAPTSPVTVHSETRQESVIVLDSEYVNDSLQDECLDLSVCVDLLTSSANTSTPHSPPLSTFSTPSPTSTNTTTAVPLPLQLQHFSISSEELTSMVNDALLLEGISHHPSLSPSSINTTPESLSSEEYSPKCNASSTEDTRKRKSSLSSTASSESDDGLSRKSLKTSNSKALSDGEKQKIRRDKNNEASKISRARRRQRQKGMQSRVKELEVTNERLRKQVEEMTAETERLKQLLIERLN